MTAPAFTGFIGLGTAMSGGALVEPSDVAYARQPVVFAGTGNYTSANVNFGSFASELSSWGTIEVVGLYNAAGTLIYSASITPVVTAMATQYAFLPGGLTLTDPDDGMPIVLAGTLQPYGPNAQRTVVLSPGSGIVRVGAPYATTSVLLVQRDQASTVDDVIDISNCLSPGDTLTGVTLVCYDPAITVNWVGYMGSLIICRTSGGAPGVTYAYKLVWTTFSGQTDTAAVDQFTSTPAGMQAVPDQLNALQLQVQAEVARAEAAEAALVTQIGQAVIVVPTVVSAAGASYDLVFGDGFDTVIDLTLTEPITLTMTGGVSNTSQRLMLFLRQPQGGGYAVTLPSNIEWAGGAPPYVSQIGGVKTIITFATDICALGTKYFGGL